MDANDNFECDTCRIQSQLPPLPKDRSLAVGRGYNKRAWRKALIEISLLHTYQYEIHPERWFTLSICSWFLQLTVSKPYGGLTFWCDHVDKWAKWPVRPYRLTLWSFPVEEDD